MFKDKFAIKGKVRLVLKDKNGRVKQVVEEFNTITNGMDAQVADRMSDAGVAAIGFMGVGTGSGQTSSSTGLAAGPVNVALTSTTQGAGADDNDVVYIGTFPAGTATGALTEAGIFQANNNTTMMTYSSFSVVNKAAGDSLIISWTVTFGSS